MKCMFTRAVGTVLMYLLIEKMKNVNYFCVLIFPAVGTSPAISMNCVELDLRYTPTVGELLVFSTLWHAKKCLSNAVQKFKLSA
jgi:hypothetical protein